MVFVILYLEGGKMLNIKETIIVDEQFNSIGTFDLDYISYVLMAHLTFDGEIYLEGLKNEQLQFNLMENQEKIIKENLRLSRSKKEINRNFWYHRLMTIREIRKIFKNIIIY